VSLKILEDDWSRSCKSLWTVTRFPFIDYLNHSDTLETVILSLRNKYMPKESPLEMCQQESSVGAQQTYHCYAVRHEEQGRRANMEDATIVADQFASARAGGAQRGSLYAVLDGHGGDACSKFCAGED